jgi:ketosteroid isomerase-like protein
MSSSLEENKALVRRFFAAIESGDFRAFDEIVTQDYNDHLAGQSGGARPSSSTSRGFTRRLLV